jgi:NADH dehydrogenase
MFAEMKKNIIFKEYPELATASNIYLIDGGPAHSTHEKASQDDTYKH